MNSERPWPIPQIPERSLRSTAQQAPCCLSIDTLQDAYACYRHALVALTRQPTNPTLKQQALLHGRTYAILTRLCADSALRRYDECTLLQDILAATTRDLPA